MACGWFRMMILTLLGLQDLSTVYQISLCSHWVTCFGLHVLWLVWSSCDESEKGEYGAKVDLSFRWSMGWFILAK